MKLMSKIYSPLRFLLSRATKIWKKFRRKSASTLNLNTIDWDRVTDRFIEPIIWIVDNFSDALGVIFVTFVCLLITFIVSVAYWMGLPYYWNTHKCLTIALVILGNWILLNVVFHYYMALITPPGHPPDVEQIPHITARCKKCQSAKPPRTHHCSICHACVLRMDHHCPWLNNCVGHFNHRYFFLFMAYVILGMLFLYAFGAPVLFYELAASDNFGEPQGFRVVNNGSHVIPLEEDTSSPPPRPKSWRRAIIITVAILCTGILAALGALLSWHTRLITRGETSIENLTNRDHRKKAEETGAEPFVNPHDYGPRENWRIFLGLSEGRTWRCVFFPSVHPPKGDGISWDFGQDRETHPLSLLVK